MKFPVDMSDFVDQPRRRVRRLDSSEDIIRSVRDRAKDTQMIDEEEKEKRRATINDVMPSK